MEGRPILSRVSRDSSASWVKQCIPTLRNVLTVSGPIDRCIKYFNYKLIDFYSKLIGSVEKRTWFFEQENAKKVLYGFV